MTLPVVKRDALKNLHNYEQLPHVSYLRGSGETVFVNVYTFL